MMQRQIIAKDIEDKHSKRQRKKKLNKSTIEIEDTTASYGIETYISTDSIEMENQRNSQKRPKKELCKSNERASLKFIINLLVFLSQSQQQQRIVCATLFPMCCFNFFLFLSSFLLVRCFFFHSISVLHLVVYSVHSEKWFPELSLKCRYHFVAIAVKFSYWFSHRHTFDRYILECDFYMSFICLCCNRQLN